MWFDLRFTGCTQSKYQGDFFDLGTKHDGIVEKFQFVAKATGIKMVHIHRIYKTFDASGFEATGGIGDPEKILGREKEDKPGHQTADFAQKNSFKTPSFWVTTTFDLPTAHDIVITIGDFFEENGY